MSRTVAEWVGKTPDTTIPPRVQLRVFDRANGRCERCTRLILYGNCQTDHRIALINGGENRENNLQCLCKWCHAAKTAVDIAEKAKTYARKAKNLGIRRQSSRPMPGSRASKWKAKIGGGWVRR